MISILGHCIVDGYFQQTESYSAFENEILVDSLNALRRQMPDSVVASPNGEILCTTFGLGMAHLIWVRRRINF